MGVCRRRATPLGGESVSAFRRFGVAVGWQLVASDSNALSRLIYTPHRARTAVLRGPRVDCQRNVARSTPREERKRQERVRAPRAGPRKGLVRQEQKQEEGRSHPPSGRPSAPVKGSYGVA